VSHAEGYMRPTVWTDVVNAFHHHQPVPMAARSKARTVFDRSNTGIAGSNPTRGMDVCPRFSVLLSCVRRGLTSG
jgi:hypothetical protein